jgi:tetratricopeptide (TPR) repeat protein
MVFYFLLIFIICGFEINGFSSGTFSAHRRALHMSNAGNQDCGQIFVCTNKWCREKGSDATMATVTFLTPESIPVVGVNCLGRCNRGPNARILTPDGGFVEGSMLRSVEAVVELLQVNLKLDLNFTAAEVLRLNYEGNLHLKSGKVDLAIEFYDKALAFGDKEQEGVLLVMRGTALLQRAYAYRLRYKDIIGLADLVLPTMESIKTVMEGMSGLPRYSRFTLERELLSRVSYVYNKLDASPRWNEVKARWPESREGAVVTTGEELLSKASLSWFLYEHALMGALQDLLAATVVLPGFAQAWRRAGDALSEMRLFRTAIEYYEVAVRLDGALGEILLPAIERLKVTEKLVENAELKGWPREAVLSLIEN